MYWSVDDVEGRYVTVMTHAASDSDGDGPLTGCGSVQVTEAGVVVMTQVVGRGKRGAVGIWQQDRQDF